MPLRGDIAKRSNFNKSDDSTKRIVEATNTSNIEPKVHCPCRYGQYGFHVIRLVRGTFGRLLIEWTGQKSCNGNCEAKNCTAQRIPSLSVAYYGPCWTANIAIRLGVRMSSPPCATLSFPQVLPPDADIFVCIRIGDIERLKTLLVEGRASVADVLAPYGISTLSLALIYQQSEVYQLLLSAGASRIPLTSMTLPDSYSDSCWSFWDQYASQNYCISASDILRDFIAQMDAKSHSKLLSKAEQYPNLERDSFTRIHKSTLGLTSEALEAVLLDCHDEIDIPDSMGRTALHLAAYQCNEKPLRLLMAQ